MEIVKTDIKIAGGSSNRDSSSGSGGGVRERVCYVRGVDKRMYYEGVC